MTWLVARVAAAMLAVLLGAGAASLIGTSAWSLIAGAVLGATAVATFDAWCGLRLQRWLSRPLQGDAPRDAGLWGEIGYWAERAIRKHAQQAQHEQLRLTQFLAAIEASPNGFLLLDAHDQIEWCNRVAADHFGLDPKRDLRQRVTNLVRSPAFVAYLQDPQRWDEPVGVARAQGGAGTLLSVLIRAYGDGHKLVLSVDVTAREQAEAMRRDFVANVSHEIRTPLTVLAGFIETLNKLPLTEVERRRVLTVMGQQTTRMQALVSDLLTLAALEGSPRPPTDRWVPVARLLARAAQDAQALSAGRHAIDLTPCDDAALVAGDDAELASAVANLMNNAVRYTPDGGRVTLAWQLLPDGSGEIVVADNGIGIAREHLPRLTERFYRVDGSRSRDTGGTGLGLAIVKHVVQRHGGELDVRSEPGKGSTFRFVLPAARVRYLEPAPDPRRQASTAA